MKKTKKSKYSENYVVYPDVGIITDEMVAKLVREHTHWWQRLNYHHMTDAGLEAQLVLMKIIEMPQDRKWYFGNREGS